MKPIRILLITSAITLISLLSVACATSTQSAAKASDSPAIPDPAKVSSAASPAAEHADQHAQEDKVPRTKPADAINMVKEGAILVDVRDISSFENMHAKGAIHVSYQDIQEGKFDKLPKDKTLIFYCT